MAATRGCQRKGVYDGPQRLAGPTGPRSIVDYAYDALGNRTQMIDSTGTTTYAYDALYRLTKVTSPGPKVVTYAYDAARNLTTVTDWLGKQTTYTYNDYSNPQVAGYLLKATLGNNVWTEYGYDNADRLTIVANKRPGPVTFSSFTYALDAAGNRKQMTNLAGGIETYAYDPLYRLTQAAYPGGPTDRYSYDAVGNRLTKNGIQTQYVYDAADQMTSAGGVAYTYDNNGNQISRAPTDTFTYDHENRLTQMVIGGATASSTYNGDGVRMSHTVAGVTTNYTWDVASGLPVVLQDGTNTYVYGLDLISATNSTGVQTYFTYDGLGSTRDLTDGRAPRSDSTRTMRSARRCPGQRGTRGSSPASSATAVPATAACITCGHVTTTRRPAGS